MRFWTGLMAERHRDDINPADSDFFAARRKNYRMRFPAILFLSLFAASRAMALWGKYSPFEPGQEPPLFPLTVLTLVRAEPVSDGQCRHEFFVPNSTAVALSIDWADEGRRVTIPARSSIAAFSAPIIGSPVCDAEAAVAELNGDAQPDFVVVTHSGGCGIASQITYLNFLLSSPTGYVARALISYDAMLSDLVDLNRDGRPEFVHCMFVSGGKGTDGRSHNYWAYNLLGFLGTEIVSANRSSPAFPKWIVYTYAENHRDSAQLTAEQRIRQWRRVWSPAEKVFRPREVSRRRDFCARARPGVKVTAVRRGQRAETPDARFVAAAAMTAAVASSRPPRRPMR